MVSFGFIFHRTWATVASDMGGPSHEEIRAKITDEEVQEWMKVRPLDFWGADPGFGSLDPRWDPRNLLGKI